MFTKGVRRGNHATVNNGFGLVGEDVVNAGFNARAGEVSWLLNNLFKSI